MRKIKKILVISGLSLVVAVGLLAITGQLSNIVHAVANFFVAESPKLVNLDPSSVTNQTSQLTVKDDLATNGYIVKARLATDVSADFTVRISLATSILCPTATPCELTTADQYIYFNITDSATSANGDTLNFDVDISSIGSFSPQDVDIVYTKVRGAGNVVMQGFNSALCAGMTTYPATGSELKLADIRDVKLYHIRKLADGNCWMVDNLAIGASTLDSTTSDFTSGTYALSAVANYNTSTYPDCNDLDTTVYPQKCGYSYTWSAATAGSANVTTALTSICPKNWRLPTSAEYTALLATSTWANVNAAWRGVYSGYYNGVDVGNRGNYWTASFNGSRWGSLVISSSGASILWDSSAYYYSVRCVAR
jgi:uncharacterized protein (TIGR02145 family)